MKEATLAAALLSALLGSISAIFLMKGTASVPKGIESWSGKSEAENVFHATARRWLIAGFWALGLAFALSAASAICAYLA
ncbi:MAG: hypothetical protein ACHQRJ_25385 [Alphaproteobacteria bacterium]